VTAQQKFDGDVTGQSTTSTPWKLDAVRRRNWTASRSNRWITGKQYFRFYRLCEWIKYNRLIKFFMVNYSTEVD